MARRLKRFQAKHAPKNTLGLDPGVEPVRVKKTRQYRYKKTVLVIIALMTVFGVTITPLRAQPRANVVATFSILGDFVRSVGGERVNVTTLVGVNGDTHIYTPTPDDAKRVAEAKLVVVNGLGLEGWLPRLVNAAGGRALIVTAST